MKDPVKARINLAYGIITGLLDGNMKKINQRAKTASLTEIEEALAGKTNMVDGKVGST